MFVFRDERPLRQRGGASSPAGRSGSWNTPSCVAFELVRGFRVASRPRARRRRAHLLDERVVVRGEPRDRVRHLLRRPRAGRQRRHRGGRDVAVPPAREGSPPRANGPISRGDAAAAFASETRGPARAQVARKTRRARGGGRRRRRLPGALARGRTGREGRHVAGAGGATGAAAGVGKTRIPPPPRAVPRGSRADERVRRGSLGRDRAGVRARPGARTTGRGAASARSPTSPTASARPPVPARTSERLEMCDTFAAGGRGDANAFGIFSLDQSRRVVRDTSARAKKTRRRASQANHPAVADSKRALLGGRDAPRTPTTPGPARGRPRARRRSRAPPLDVAAFREGERPPPHARSAPRASLSPPRAHAAVRGRLAFEFARAAAQALEAAPSRVAGGFLSKIYERKGKGQRRGSIAGLLGKPAAGAGAPSSPAEAPRRLAPRLGAARDAVPRRKTTAGDADVPGRTRRGTPRPPLARARPPRPPRQARPVRLRRLRGRERGRRRTPRSPRARRIPAAKSRAARADADPLGLEPHRGGRPALLGPGPEPRSAPRETRPRRTLAPAAAPEGAPRPAPDAGGCVTHRILRADAVKRRRVTFAEVDAYDAEEDEDAEEPRVARERSRPVGVFGSPGDAEPSDGDRSAGPRGVPRRANERGASVPERVGEANARPKRDASGRGGGSPMSPDYARTIPGDPAAFPRRGDDGEPAASPRARARRQAEPEGPPKGSAFDALDGRRRRRRVSGGGRPLRLRDGNARRLDAAARLWWLTRRNALSHRRPPSRRLSAELRRAARRRRRGPGEAARVSSGPRPAVLRRA